MIRYAAAAIAAVFLCGTAEASIVRSHSGASASVAPDAAGKFQCLIDRLDGSGYRIKFMGGYGPRSNPSKHPIGRALDVNQFARNVVRPILPAAATAYAASCGLFHGALWKHRPDTGHFEVPGPNVGGHRRHHRRAHRRHR